MPSGVYIRKIGLKRRPMSEETKKKIGLSHITSPRIYIPWNKGKKVGNGWKGKKHTAETKNKISKSIIQVHPHYWLGKNLSEGHRKKLSIAKLGKKPSVETRKKLSEARLERVFPFQDTSIEVKLQNWLKEQNIEFETHHPILGQPDIFIKPNICIFADGCYWHKCFQCGKGSGRQRDLEVTKKLQEEGYIVYRLWEHEIKNEDFSKVLL